MQGPLNTFSELLRRMRMLLHREQTAQDLDEEMRLHLELREAQQTEAGTPAKDARAAALRRFGNATLVRERSYNAWGWGWLETLLQDVRYGVRGLLRSPVVTAVALLSLALGIGANTAIFSLIDAVMLRSLPVKDPQQLVLLGGAGSRGFQSGFAVTDVFSYPFFRLLQQRNHSFSDVGAMLSLSNDVHGLVQGHSDPEPLHVQLVSGTYFSTLGVTASLGRLLNDDDDRVKNSAPVAVVSDGWWKRSLGGDPKVLGRTIRLGQTNFQIVGVAPPEFFGVSVGEAPDAWIPLSMMQSVPPHWDSYTDALSQCLLVFGRLKPGISAAQATTEVNLLRQQILPNFPNAQMTAASWTDLRGSHVPLTSMTAGFSDLRQQFSEPLRVLMAIAALVLFIACANIANLLLARSTVRAREFAVRQALGAQRMRLVRQLLTESLLIAGLGGVLGIGLAQAAARLLLQLVSVGHDIVPLDVSVNGRLLFFTAGLTLLTSLIFGVVPALRATRFDLSRSLKDGRGASSNRSKGGLARTLVVSQVAVSLVLLVAAGLFLRSLERLTSVDLGFQRKGVLRIDIDESSAGYAENDARLPALYEAIERRVTQLPGVRASSFSAFTFHEGAWFTPVEIPGAKQKPPVTVIHNVVGTGYFQTMQIPVVTGRSFLPGDTATSQKVSILSAQMAHTLFPGESAVGRHYVLGPPQHGTDLLVVGVVKDAKFGSAGETTYPIDYIPYTQHNGYLGDFEARYTGKLSAVSIAVQQAIHGIDRNLLLSNVSTLDEQVSSSYVNDSLVAQLSAFFGLLAVFLSAIGIYGLMSYMVSRRTNEIGIRMALGAARPQVSWLVMREVLMLVAVGVAIGVPVTLAAARFIDHLLFGLKGNDPFSLLAAVVVMLAVAALAGYVPARRAARVEPMVALRYE